MTKTNVEIVKFNDIKYLINSTSRKYNNFKDFSIVNNLKNEGTYIVYLNFYDTEIEYRQECIQVEIIKNVLHREIGDAIKNAENDFDNFIGQEIIENIEKINFVDIILKYKTNRTVKNFNLSHLKRSSCGHNYKTNISDIYFRITCYDPTDIYDLVREGKTDKELYIESNENGMLISLFDNNKAILLGKDDNSVKDILYFIEYEKDSAGYIISKYDEKDNNNWNNKRVVVEKIETSSINTKDLSDEIVCFLQEKFNVVIDNQSKIRLEEELKWRLNNKNKKQ
ncbi:hypothetical protein [Terrisporobacter glycolicus]|uniref:Uncharacterized protein n=1 Tax=Terrisporobacter glycolicus ATCC 14880 = DSM 1288 TaxID=1121315 RepID=A0ABZ2EW22_9FIRM|nr:hypothetical protein [Terrisporobacter glycolicus]